MKTETGVWNGRIWDLLLSVSAYYTYVSGSITLCLHQLFRTLRFANMCTCPFAPHEALPPFTFPRKIGDFAKFKATSTCDEAMPHRRKELTTKKLKRLETNLSCQQMNHVTDDAKNFVNLVEQSFGQILLAFAIRIMTTGWPDTDASVCRFIS